MVGVKLYVEGGGDTNQLKTACRKGFAAFLRKAGLVETMPRIVACGSRQDAYDSFCVALENGNSAMLLVDSEAPVSAECMQGNPESWKPWQHLHNRPGDCWEKPAKASEQECHLMVQCMEAWFLTDRASLREFFGQGFHLKSLPAEGNQIESIAKESVYKSLKKATKNSESKGEYGKGEHSFKILEMIDPVKIMNASPWAKRFIDEVKKKMNS
ncbi:MAG: DUF4276 family protein [Chlorobiaceae bacterium]|nr:DUF4276 family protein [Chlorobiaceae bacterium]